MLVIRWFGAFRRVQDIRSSILYELSDPGKERAAEFAYPYEKKERVWGRYNRRLLLQRVRELQENKFDPRVRSWIEYDDGSYWPVIEITYRVNVGHFSVGSRVGFLYPNNAVRRMYWTDVWSYATDDGTGRLKAKYPDNQSDHVEAWVVGKPCGVVIRTDFCPHDRWWAKVEKTARTFAKMKGIPVYQLAEDAHGLQLRKVN